MLQNNKNVVDNDVGVGGDGDDEKKKRNEIRNQN